MGLFRFAGKRATADLMQIMAFGDDFNNTVPNLLMDFWYLGITLAFLIFILFYLYKRISIYKQDATPVVLTNRSLFVRIFLHAFVLFLIFIGFRGGLQYKPINILSAAKYGSGQYATLVLNSPFTFIKTLGKNNLQEKNYFDSGQLEKIYSSKIIPADTNEFSASNVVLIILESIGNEYIGKFNKGIGYTPFLDSLIDHSLVFPNTFANGKRSIEGIPAILSGIPALMTEPFITSAYASNTFSSIASHLKTEGYYSCFFHGGTNGTMGFDNFARSAGFDKYFGRKEYGNDKDFDGTWGIFDEPFMLRFGEELNKVKQPFFGTVFTLSSHHPYSIPENLKTNFAPGTLPIHQSVRYTDHSLRSFFNYASKQKWFDNTLFVVTTDHTALSEKSYYQSRVGMYSIPLIFYKSDGSLKGDRSRTSQQIDILPSVLDYLNYDKPYFAFGKSVFDSTDTGFAVNFINGTYQYIENGYSLILDTIQSNSLFHFEMDKTLKNNLVETDTILANEMEKKLKAIIQVYNSSLISNKMYY